MPRGFKPPADDERCIATTRKGTRCPKYRVRGTTVCLAHGAKAPQVRAAAQRRVAEQKTRELAERIEVDVPEFTSGQDAARYLLERVTRRSAQFGALADQRGDLTYTDRAGVERLRAAVAGERAWLDSLARVLAVAVQAEAAQRAQAGTASGIIDRVMLALSLAMTNIERRHPEYDGLREEIEAEFTKVARTWTADHQEPERSRLG